MGDYLAVLEGIVLVATLSAPAQPAPPDASISYTTATVTWAAPSTDGGSVVTGYVLQSSTDGVIWADVTAPAGTAFDVVGLTPGGTVQFRVLATNAIGNSPPSLSSDAVSPTAEPPRTTTTTPPPTTTTTTPPPLFDPCPPGGHPFNDVAVTSFAYTDIGCIYQLEITTGISPTAYGPNNYVTREQMGAFLARLARAAAP